MGQSTYLALGDSMSIDLYPEADARHRLGWTETGLGATSLLYRNVDAVWPEFANRDLARSFPGVGLVDCTSDGAMIGTVEDVITELGRVNDVTFVTLTIGGNDLLAALALGSLGIEAIRAEVGVIAKRYDELVARIRTAYPEAWLVLTTIYDPTDGTGLLWPNTERLPIELLKQLNERIRRTARDTAQTRLADVHLHFTGHGIHTAASWYWTQNPIEPSADGANEIRRVWWRELEAVSAR